MSSPDHRVLQACAGGDGGGDGRGSQGVEVQIRSSGVDFGLVEVVSQAVGRDVRSICACDYEIGRFFAVARFFYEFSELGRNRLRGIACGRFRGLQTAVFVGGMANMEGLRLEIPVLDLEADYLPYA